MDRGGDGVRDGGGQNGVDSGGQRQRIEGGDRRPWCVSAITVDAQIARQTLAHAFVTRTAVTAFPAAQVEVRDYLLTQPIPGHALADLGNGPDQLVSRNPRELVWPVAEVTSHAVEDGQAHTAGPYPHKHLAASRLGDWHFLPTQRSSPLMEAQSQHRVRFS